MRFALYGKDPGIAPWVVLGTLVVCFVLACWGYDPQRGFGGLTKRAAGVMRRPQVAKARARLNRRQWLCAMAPQMLGLPALPAWAQSASPSRRARSCCGCRGRPAAPPT